jgi:hypothetical protein
MLSKTQKRENHQGGTGGGGGETDRQAGVIGDEADEPGHADATEISHRRGKIQPGRP